MIYAGLIDEFLDGAQERIASVIGSAYHSLIDPLFGWLYSPLTPWFFYAGLIFAACVVVGWFFPFKWVRAALGFLLLLVGAFVAGGYEMHKQMAEKAAAEAAKKKKK